MNSPKATDQLNRGAHQSRMHGAKICRRIKISDRVVYKNIKAYKGNKKDTNLLNINFKTLILNHLEAYYQSKQFSLADREGIEKFRNRSPSFQSLILLIYGTSLHTSINSEGKDCPKVLNIKDCLKNYVQSDLIMKDVLRNNGNFQIKIWMLKYLEALRCTIVSNGKVVRWKDLKKLSPNK